MGVFSWITCDTNRSIAAENNEAERPTFPVFMKDNRGNVWREDNYKGYGVFGGKDYYALVAEMNGYENANLDPDIARVLGLDMAEKQENLEAIPDELLQLFGGDDFRQRFEIQLPRLFENESSKFEDYPPPKRCPDQGYFYASDEDAA